MKATLPLLAGLLLAAGFHAPAAAWASANRYGGRTVSGGGQTEHVNAAGGSTTHDWDGGTSHTNAAGGTTTGAYGAGAVHTTDTGYSSYHPPAAGYPAGYHPPVAGYPAYAPYHPPPPVYASGCYNCAGAVAAGVVVGAAVGASVASANTAAATSNAYAAGVAAGSTATAYAMGVNYMALPPGAMVVNKYGTNYYLLGNTWFKPAYGANGVYYVVVPAP
jgi:hypothetical protein